MASRNLRLLSVGFILIALCTHHCSARKVLNNQEKAQPKADMEPAPVPESGLKLGQNNDTMPEQEGEIGLEACGGGCVPTCAVEPCPVIEGGYWQPQAPLIEPQAPRYVPTPPIVTPQAPHWVPTPPIVTPQQPHMVPTPPIVIPEPPIWVAYTVPVPSTPCTPCEPWYGPGPCPCPCEEGVGTESNDNKEKQDGEIMHGRRPDKMEEGTASSTSRTADAPMAALMDGSNVHA